MGMTTRKIPTDSTDKNTKAERPSQCAPGGILPRPAASPGITRPEPHATKRGGVLAGVHTRLRRSDDSPPACPPKRSMLRLRVASRGAPPETSPPEPDGVRPGQTAVPAGGRRAADAMERADPARRERPSRRPAGAAIPSPASSACPGPDAGGAGLRPSGVFGRARRGTRRPGAAGDAAPVARLGPALARAAACLVLAVAALIVLPAGALAQENPVRPSWSLVPSGLSDGDKFRLIFTTSTLRTLDSTDIADYNSFVQDRAAAGHADIRSFSDQFRVVGSTASVDARDNTGTTGTGVPIYWLNGNKAADNYADFYDDSWDSLSPKDESGLTGRTLMATGSEEDGTAEAGKTLGAASVRYGSLSSGGGGPIHSSVSGANDGTLRARYYGLSPVFTVQGPAVSNVSLTSRPPDGTDTFKRGEQIEVTVTFNEPVTVDTDGSDANVGVWLSLRRGAQSTGYLANFLRQASPSKLVFALTVTATHGNQGRDGLCIGLGCNADTVRLEGAATITAASDGVNATRSFAAVNTSYKVDGNTSGTTGGVCGRQHAVRDAIVTAVSAAASCDEVTATQLAAIGSLDVSNKGIGSLRKADFAGLTGLTSLNLSSNSVSYVPGDLFEEVTALVELKLNGNAFGTLPASAFSGLTALELLNLNDTGLSSLPAGLLSDLGALEMLNLGNNRLASLPAAALADVAGTLEDLLLHGNQIGSIGAGAFDAMTGLRQLLLHDNALASLPDDLFAPLTGLTTARLDGNPGFDDFAPVVELSSSEIHVGAGGVRVDLEASTGASPWGDNVTWSWTQIDSSGTTVTIEEDDTAQAWFTAPARTSADDTELTFRATARGRGTSGARASAGSAEADVTLAGRAKIVDIAVTTRPADNSATFKDGDLIEITVTFNEPVTHESGTGTSTVPLVIRLAIGVHVTDTVRYFRQDHPNRLVYARTAAEHGSGNDFVDNNGFCIGGTTAQTACPTTATDVLSLTGNASIEAVSDGSNASRSFGVRNSGFNIDTSKDAQTGGICGREPGVRKAILQAVPTLTASDCHDVSASDLAGVTSLDVSDESVESLRKSDFAGLTGLTSLDLSGNSLDYLPDDLFDDLAALTSLSLANNDIAEVSKRIFREVTGLEELRLNGNPLGALSGGTLSGLTALEVLNLNDTGLASVRTALLSGLGSLRVLNLGDNSLTRLPGTLAHVGGSLEELYLHNNGIGSIGAGAFDAMTGLRQLTLHGNALASLPAGLFDRLTALESLRLDDNALASLPDDLFAPLTGLTLMRLDGNPGSDDFAPVVEVSDQDVNRGDVRVDLEATTGASPWGGNVTWSWTQTDSSGTTVTIEDADTAEAWFTSPEPASVDDLELTFQATARGRGTSGAHASEGSAEADVTLAGLLEPLPTPTGDALVSNTGQGSPLNSTSGHMLAQRFETGSSHADGYTISEVGVRLGSSSVSVRIRENSSGEPGDLVAVLTSTGVVTSGVHWFSAPVATRLESGESYWITVNEELSQHTWPRITDNTEDSGGAAGWSIGNGSLTRSTAGQAWGSNAFSLLIAIKGEEAEAVAPMLQSAVVPASGELVELTFDEDLNISTTDVPPASAFTVEAGGEVSVDAVGATMHETLMLYLSRPIYAGETVTVSYTVPSSGKVIEDADGNDAAAFTGQAVTNNSTVPVPAPAPCPADANWCAKLTVGVDTNSVLYGWKKSSPSHGMLDDERIEHGDPPAWDLKHIQHAGGTISFWVGNEYILRGTVFNLGGSEFVADEDSEQTRTGSHGWTLPAGFVPWVVGQEVRVSANLPPVPVSATVEGASLVLTYVEDLDTGSVPAADAYSVSVDGTAANPSSVSIAGNKVTLTLASAVAAGEDDVTVSYTPGSSPVQDPSGLKAAGLTDHTVDNRTGNQEPTGEPVIEGTPQVGERLTAMKGDLDDPDMLPTTAFPTGYSFQWVRVDGATETPISGATSRTYDPAPADVGHTLRVEVSFTDLAGFLETVASEATAAVRAAAEGCSARTHANWCATLTVREGVVGGFTFYGWRAGGQGALDDATIDYGGLPGWSLKDIYHDQFGRNMFLNFVNSLVPRGTVFNLAGSEFVADSQSEFGSAGYSWTEFEGNIPAGFVPWLDGQKVTVSANLPPVLVSAAVDGASLVLTYAEDLDTGSVPAADAYSVTVDGAAAEPSNVSISGNKVTLTLASAVTGGPAVTLTYTVPASNPVQDPSGLKAAALTDEDVETEDTTGPMPVSGVVSAAGTQLTLVFDEDLDITATDLPPASAFTVEADEAEVAVSSVTASSGGLNEFILVLSAAVDRDQEVTVSYVAPDPGKVIEDAEGNDAPDFDDFEVTNNSTVDTTGPAPESGRVAVAGTQILLTFDEDLEVDAHDDVPPASAFTVEADGVVVALDDVFATSSDEITLFLSTVIGAGQKVTVTYTKPGSDPVIEDAEGNETESFEDFDKVTNNSTVDTTPPAPESGSVSTVGTQIVLTFDEDLDIGVGDVPPASAFTVEADGVEVAVDSVFPTSQDAFTLLLSTPIYAGQTVTVSYTKPGSGKVIEDAEGNDTEDFDTKDFDTKDFTMTNNSTVDDPRDAMGQPTLSGTAEAGQTLTASTSGISDPDGKTKAEAGDAGYAYTYRWYRVDSDGVSNRTEISGATAATYTLTADDVGRKIIVEVAFVDDTDVREGPLASDPHPAFGTVAATDPSVPAVVTGIAFTNEPADGVYNPGDVIEVTVTFDKAVDVTGSPRLKIVPYSTAAVYAGLESSAGTARTLVFRHAVTGPSDGRLFTSGNGAVLVNANTLELNGGTIRNPGTTTDANLDHALVAGLEVNTRLVEDIVISSTPRVPAADTGGVKVFGPGDTVEFTVRFSDTITVSGTPTLGIKAGTIDITADYSSGGGTNELHFEATMPDPFREHQNIKVADNDIATNGLQRNGATLTDSGGRAVNVNHGEFERTAVLDGLAPQLLATPEGATVNRKNLELSYQYNTGTTQADYLDPGSVPGPTDFVVSEGGSAVAVARVDIPDLNTVRLTLDDEVEEGTTVTVSYTPGANPIQDAGGNAAAALTGRAVRNDTPEADPGDTRLVDAGGNALDPEDGDGEGRLEVFFRDEWGTVCDDRFDRDFDDPGTPGDTTKVPNQAAHLACRWAKYETGAMVSNAGKPLPLDQEQPIWLDDVRCVSATDKHWRPAGSPDPTGLHHCYHAGVSLHNCGTKANPDHTEDVWLACTGTFESAPGEEEAALTAVFEDLPGSHDGATPFTFRIVLSEAIANDADDVRDNVVKVTGGSVGSATSVNGQTDEWQITVDPDGAGDITLTVEAGGTCGDPGVLCTAGGEGLSETVTGTVEGPAGVQPLTAQFENGPGTHDGTGPFNVFLRFSEAPANVKNIHIKGALTISGGRILRVRVVGGAGNDEAHRRVEIEPDGDADVRLSLFPTTDCNATNALCTADGRKLESPISLSIPGPASAPPPPAPITATFENVPEEHQGKTRLDLHVRFSEPPTGGKNAVAASLTMARAAKWGVKGLDTTGHLYRSALRPHDFRPITVTLKPTSSCSAAGALCSAGGARLEDGISVTIPGPVAIRVADAEVDEAPDAVLAFVVTLDRVRHAAVEVDYATEDGSAIAGDDYTAASGTLTFAAGETTKTIEIAIIDDAHDEGDETMVLRLSNPVGARIADGEATGTIKNTDLMPKAWIARFGRTFAEDVSNMAKDRLTGTPSIGTSLTLAGYSLASGKDFKGLDEPRFEERTVTALDLATRSTFSFGTGTPEGGHVGLWGRASLSSFTGQEEDLSLDGDLTTWFLGADWRSSRSALGAMVSHTQATGGYQGASDGRVEADLTGVFPYGRHALSERVSLWGVAGYGAGALTLTPDGQPSLTTDMDLAMAAGGVRTVLLEAGASHWPELALETDVLGVRTHSDAVKPDGQGGGSLAAATAEMTRVRMGVEGTWSGLRLGGADVRPSLEIGLRRDGGDAETGMGVDVGAGLIWENPKTGLSAALHARTLLTHESDGFEERGIAGSIGWDPRPKTERGFSLRLTHAAGAQATGGMDALLSKTTLKGLGRAEDEKSPERLELGLGYGVPVLNGLFLATPELGLGLSETERRYTAGWRLRLRDDDEGSLEFRLQAVRREPTGTEPSQEFGVSLSSRW